MKIKNIMQHKIHAAEQNQAEAPLAGATSENSPSDKFSKEGLLTSAITFAENKGKDTTHRLMSELNFNDCNRHRKTEADRMLNLSEGTALFFAFDTRAYTPDAPYVKNAEIRKAVTEKLQQENPDKDIFWVENVGVAEPGSGFYATVPVIHSHGATCVAGFGFSVGTILRYRTSQAVVGEKSRKGKMALASPKDLPINPETARKMKAGQEFEICGQGKLRGDANIGVRYGADVGICVAGLNQNLGVIATAALEYGINVMSLDGENKVRVTIRKIDQESFAEVSITQAGLIIPPNKLFPGNFGLPAFGHGILKYFAEHKGPPSFEAYLTDYTSLTLNCSLTHTHKHLHLRCYDLDLANPRAAEAYSALMRLDIREAEAQAAIRDGVIKIELTETQYSNKAVARLALCTEKLYLREALKLESHGELVNAEGQHKVYRDAAFKKHYENWLTGKRDALWESVNVKIDEEPAKTYYHFHYQKNDFVTHQYEIDKFFKFADAIGIKKADETKSEVVDMHTFQKFLSNKDDSKLDVDLYFTSSGVDQIRDASREDIALAYLSSSAELEDKISDHPCLSSDLEYRKQAMQIFEAYRQYCHEHRLTRSPRQIHSDALKRLNNKYIMLCGRDLKRDCQAIKKAEQFADQSRNLIAKEQDRHKIGKFFTRLGRSHLSYAQAIATLAKIAGRENVLVHVISASGGGIALKSIDEGALIHPRDEAVKQTLRKPKVITA